jgi:hypothetical protein
MLLQGIKLGIHILLVAATAAVAINEASFAAEPNVVDLSEADTAAVISLFKFTHDDPEFLHVGGSISVYEDGRQIVSAYMTTLTATPDSLTCVVDTRYRFGNKAEDAISWHPDEYESVRTRTAWKLSAPGNCDVLDESVAKISVDVDLDVPIDVIPTLLRLEQAIFQSIFEFSDGAPYQDWASPKMYHLLIADESAEPVRYRAIFAKKGEAYGPDILFYLTEGGIRAESVSHSKFNW